jgi:hypothetical protein
MTHAFLTQICDPTGLANMMAEGKSILDQKDSDLLALLNKGAIHLFTEEYVWTWKLPPHWLNISVFIIDTTNISLDTTEAAHLVFEHYPNVNVFINYRKNVIGGVKGKRDCYTYSARSRSFDLIHANPYFKGHSTSAGMSLFKDENPILPFQPFVSTNPTLTA